MSQNPTSPKASDTATIAPAPARFIIQQRDIEFLVELFHCTLMTRDQILATQAFWNSIVRLNTRLRLLVSAGYLVRHTLPFYRQSVYGLGPTASAVLATALNRDIETVRRQARIGQSPQFVEHTLKIVDCKISISRAASLAQIPMLWRSERQVRHEYRVRSGSTLQTNILKPDGFLRLDVEGVHRHHFLEIDLSHRSQAAMQKTFEAYRTYQATVFAQTYEADRFLVLCVVPGERRRSHLREVATAAGASSLVRFTTYDRLFTTGPFGPIWTSPESDAPSLLF